MRWNGCQLAGVGSSIASVLAAVCRPSCSCWEHKCHLPLFQKMDREMREQQKQLDRETFGEMGNQDGGYGYGPRRGGFRGRKLRGGYGGGGRGSGGYSNY